jgi:hypothetical protein
MLFAIYISSIGLLPLAGVAIVWFSVAAARLAGSRLAVAALSRHNG